MRKRTILLLIICLICFSFIKYKVEKNITKVPIKWVNDLNKDFSFKDKWSYPEGIFKNEFGQLSCDSGICLGIEGMKRGDGKILKDSLEAFYKIVDTTHIYHTLKSTTSVYEWFGSNFINFKKHVDNSIIGKSECHISTHSSLNIIIEDDSITAWIDFHSITNLGRHKFPIKKGEIKIDKQYFKKGIIKAEFDLTFLNTLDKDKVIFWKGLIYSNIITNN
ncbi:hypothetical protein Q4Q35_21605 [Flavivirga aquimarina]|uniref:Uncharacterized protein n=1 Tax=Flavivirga aquimarina TaxID=2027862 RepID=A0ABT8WH14_9FLAO|nr:hypothetical protein [Flavivirga aquimarina]MDO5972406.1 hypothetical protein [Flavivirga aquimarina]